MRIHGNTQYATHLKNPYQVRRLMEDWMWDPRMYGFVNENLFGCKWIPKIDVMLRICLIKLIINREG